MQLNTLSRDERLRGRKRINELFATSQGGFCYPFRWVLSSECEANIGANTDSEAIAEMQSGVSVLFSVPKKNIRRANKRNLLKRRMREAYRLNKHSFVSLSGEYAKKINVALLYVAKEPLEYGVIEPAIKKILVAMEKEYQ